VFNLVGEAMNTTGVAAMEEGELQEVGVAKAAEVAVIFI